MAALWLLCTTLLFPLTLEQVVITPSGSLYIPINSQRIISCEAVGGQVTRWIVTFRNAEQRSCSMEGTLGPGILIANINGNSSTLIVNTTNTDIAAVTCIGDIGKDFIQNRTTLNLTIYGIPSSPTNISITVNNHSLIASWYSPVIDTVSMQFNLTLTVFNSNGLDYLTGVINDTQVYTFILKDKWSCKHFKLCIGARNYFGQGNDSCIDKILPNLLSVDIILFSLLRNDSTITALVSVKIPEACRQEDDDRYYALEMTTELENTSRERQPVPVTHNEPIEIAGLITDEIYTFRILSICTSTEMVVSESVSFFTGGYVQGVNICKNAKETTYHISCVYINEHNFTGCGFLMTGANVKDIKGTIVGKKFKDYTISRISAYDRIIVYDIEDFVVSITTFNHSGDVDNCFSVKEVTTDSITPTTTNSVSAGVIAAIVVICSMVLFCTILLLLGTTTICLYRQGCCTASKNGKQCKSRILRSRSQKDCVKTNCKSVADIPLKLDHKFVLEEANADIYDKLYKKEVAPEENFSKLNQGPIYYVLEKGCHSDGATSPGSDAPCFPARPNSLVSPVKRNDTQTCPVELIYDEVGKPTLPTKHDSPTEELNSTIPAMSMFAEVM